MPNEIQPVDLSKCLRLINHGPVVLISAAAGGRRNLMTAAWVMPLDFDPPKVAAVIDKPSYTRELIEASGEFALNVPVRQIAGSALAAGSISGRSIDKFAKTGLEAFPASRVAAPLVRGCAAWLECRALPDEANRQRHDLFLAEIVAAWADPALFSDGQWHFPDPARRTIHYQSGGAFFETGETFDLGE